MISNLFNTYFIVFGTTCVFIYSICSGNIAFVIVVKIEMNYRGRFGITFNYERLSNVFAWKVLAS